MTRLNIEGLGTPPRKYRPDLISRGFESEHDARKEDRIRARRLEQAAKMATKPEHAQRARALARLLEDGPADDLETLASSIVLRRHRINVGGALLAFADSYSGQIATACLWPKSMEIPGPDLANLNPLSAGHALRSDCNRHGVSAANGGAIFFLDGEYEPNADVWRLHYHGLLLGEKIKALNGLRDTRKYQSTRYRQKPGRSQQRVRINWKLTDLSYHLPYLLKSFWPSRWEGEIDGEHSRQKHRSRIPEPRHSQWLLWMDRWRLSDLCVLHGLEVGSEGLRFTEKYTNGVGG